MPICALRERPRPALTWRSGPTTAGLALLAMLALDGRPAAGQTAPVATGTAATAPQTPLPQPAVEKDTASDGDLIGRFLAGAAWGSLITVDGSIGSQHGLSPFVRWNSRRKGWGPSFGLSWYEADLRVPVGGRATTLGSVRVRPVMAGIGYRVVKGRTRTTFGLVGGYAFNRAAIDRPLPPGFAATVDIRNAWAAGPKVDVVVAATRRLAFVGSVAYVLSNPDITVRVWQGGEPTSIAVDHIRGDSVSVRVGAALSLF